MGPDPGRGIARAARTYSSTKYEALAPHGLARPEEAAVVAARTGSDLVVGRLGSPADRAAALARIAGSLPAELPASFVRAGRHTVSAPRMR